VRCIDGDLSNIALRNLERIERKRTVLKELPVWDIREMYASGIAPDDISRRLTVSISKVRQAVAGFERLTVEKVEEIRKIIEK